MARYNRNRRFTMPFEVERGNLTVEYEVEFSVSPGEPERGPTYDCGGTPAEPPAVEGWSVYFVGQKTCPKCSGVGRTKVEVGSSAALVLCGQCHGKRRIEFRVERPELEDLVTEDELMEYANAEGGYDGPDTTAEARGER